MSEPLSSTGETEDRSCPSCGAVVAFERYVGCYGGPARWMCPKHDAPCGLPCMAGGVSGAHYRSGEAHGLMGYPPGRNEATEWEEGGWYDGVEDRPCPACTGLAAVRSVDAARIPRPA